METTWSSDRHLDILVLGPMGEDEENETSTLPIRDALEALLEEEEIRTLLEREGVQSSTVHVPVGQNQPGIVQTVLSLLDIADLVVFNLTPKSGQPDRANVFYELGLVHALGLPTMLVVQSDAEVPFYAQGTRQYRVPVFTVDALADELRTSLREFLDRDAGVSFGGSHVSEFYDLPIVDISAAVGLATGYYYNFLSRMLVENAFLTEYPDAFRAVLYVRPASLRSTYQADQQRLRSGLSAEGFTLETRKLDPPASDKKGPLWNDHVEDIVLDIPRAIYPLRSSPRLLAYAKRGQSMREGEANRLFLRRQTQIEDTLLRRVETALRYLTRSDNRDMRRSLLRFTTIERAPALVRELRGG